MTDVRKLVQQTAHMNGKPSVVNVICFVAEKVEELGIHDCHDEIEGVIGIGNDDEQRRLPVSDGVQFHLIVAHQLPQLCNVEGRKPCTAGNQNRLGGFAGGKAIFAFKPYEEQKAALEAITLQPYTAHTIIVKKALMDDLEHIRDKQIAYDMEEKEIGVICAAAPVLGANNTAIAAISLSGPSFRMTEQNLITVSEELKKAAKELGKELSSL